MRILKSLSINIDEINPGYFMTSELKGYTLRFKTVKSAPFNVLNGVLADLGLGLYPNVPFRSQTCDCKG